MKKISLDFVKIYIKNYHLIFKQLVKQVIKKKCYFTIELIKFSYLTINHFKNNFSKFSPLFTLFISKENFLSWQDSFKMNYNFLYNDSKSITVST